jgi:hypothetical protein
MAVGPAPDSLHVVVHCYVPPCSADTRQRDSKSEFVRCIALADARTLFVGTNHGAVHRATLPAGNLHAPSSPVQDLRRLYLLCSWVPTSALCTAQRCQQVPHLQDPHSRMPMHPARRCCWWVVSLPRRT